MPEHEKIDYVEFQVPDMSRTKAFFSQAFGWRFQDFGEDYAAFSGEGLDGGFALAETSPKPNPQAPLVIFYSEALEETLRKVTEAGGKISRETFSFPGGRRFHFVEPGGNELAVWSDRERPQGTEERDPSDAETG